MDAQHDITTHNELTHALAAALRAVCGEYLSAPAPHDLTREEITARAVAAFNAGRALGAYDRFKSLIPEGK